MFNVHGQFNRIKSNKNIKVTGTQAVVDDQLNLSPRFKCQKKSYGFIPGRSEFLPDHLIDSGTIGDCMSTRSLHLMGLM